MGSEQDRHGVLNRVIDYCYERALSSSSASALQLAAEYTDRSRSLEENIDALVRWQNIKCATAGFITGLGGLATLPIALPADLFANYYIQVRMIVAIALMCGHDVRSDRVRGLVFVCLAGNAAADLFKDAGAQLGKQAASRALVRSAGRAGFTRAVPLLGAIVGAAVDGATCLAIGRAAKRVFMAKHGPRG